MTRRLTLTLVGAVAAALTVSLVVTTALLAFGARVESRRELTRNAQSLARVLEDLQANPRALRAVGGALQLSDQRVVRVGPAGRVVGELPAGVTTADLHAGTLGAGGSVSGVHGSLVWSAAATPASRRGGLVVVVLTRRTGAGLRRAAPLVGAASLLALAVVGVVAVDAGRRLTRPLRAAEAATRRIAAGDLAARVPVDAGDDELDALGRSINTMAVNLERSRGLERQFLLSVSHDLRTPLTSIRGYAEAVVDGRAPDARAAAGVILSESRRLERLVGDLLELARLDARRFSLDLRPTEVGEVVRETVEGFRPAADDAGVELDLDLGSCPPAAVDPDRLAQVVANLIENALRFASARITVVVGGQDGRARIWVDDDGPGIASSELDRVFERFYRSSRTETRSAGTGLGLAIVRELVSAMGGEVAALPGAGGGSRMAVLLAPAP